jgi:hypothetical protein
MGAKAETLGAIILNNFASQGHGQQRNFGLTHLRAEHVVAVVRRRE